MLKSAVEATCERGMELETHPIQHDSDLATGLYCCGVAPELRHFSYEAHGAVCEVFEVAGVDAGGCCAGHCPCLYLLW